MDSAASLASRTAASMAVFLGAELAHHLQDGSQLTLLAQPLDTLLVQSGRGLSGLHSFQSLELDGFQLLFHGLVLSFWK